MQTCTDCLRELPEEDFPLNKQSYNRKLKVYDRYPTCKRCKFSTTKYRWNVQQRVQYKDPFKCKEAKSREKYSMEKFDSKEIVGWNNDSEIYC